MTDMDALGELGIDGARFEEPPPPPRGLRSAGAVLALVITGMLVLTAVVTWVIGTGIVRLPPISISLWPNPSATSYLGTMGPPRADLSTPQAREAIRAALESARIAAWMELRDGSDVPDVEIPPESVHSCDTRAEAVVLGATLRPLQTVPENTKTLQQRTDAAVALIVAAWSEQGIVPTDPITSTPGSSIRFTVPEGGAATLDITSDGLVVQLHTACIAVDR